MFRRWFSLVSSHPHYHSLSDLPPLPLTVLSLSAVISVTGCLRPPPLTFPFVFLPPYLFSNFLPVDGWRKPPLPTPKNKNSILLRIHQQIHSPLGWMCCRHRRAGFSLRLRVLINASWITYWDVASRARNDITAHHEFFLVVLGFRQNLLDVD